MAAPSLPSTSPATKPFLGGPASLAVFRCAGIAAAPIRRHRLVTAARKDADIISLDRRELLLAGGAVVLPGTAKAVPVGDPDLNRCGPSEVDMGPGKHIAVACCAPKPKRPVIDFKPDTGPMRTRLAAHLLDEDYIAKYNEAYAKMRALPASDPRSMKQQANVHCAYCNSGYRQTGDRKAVLQIHFNWLFFPWHRFYLYFHEKILGSLINDPTFALPFWNWDNQEGGNEIPPFFQRQDSALYDVERNPNATIVNLTALPGSDASTDREVIKQQNVTSMWKNVMDTRGAQEFIGSPYRKGQTNLQGAGSVEGGPHTAVHVFAGKKDNPFWEDMGNFYSAGKDPLFYCHHSNVDRTWYVWQNKLKRQNWTDPDFLDAEFLFFDQNADLVRCKVKDSLDAEASFKYNYEAVPQDEVWMNYVPKSAKAAGVTGGSASLVGGNAVAMAAEYPDLSDVELRGEPVVASVARPKPTSGADEEILVLEGVEVLMGSGAALEVFINLPEANAETSIACAEYVGSIYNVPHVMPGMTGNETRTTNSRRDAGAQGEGQDPADQGQVGANLVCLIGVTRNCELAGSLIKEHLAPKPEPR